MIIVTEDGRMIETVSLDEILERFAHQIGMSVEELKMAMTRLQETGERGGKSLRNLEYAMEELVKHEPIEIQIEIKIIEHKEMITPLIINPVLTKRRGALRYLTHRMREDVAPTSNLKFKT